MEKKINITLLKEAKEFISSLNFKTAKKVAYNIRAIEYGKFNVDIFKKISNFVWEIRIIYNRKKIRLFGFYAKNKNGKSIFVITHGIIKKTGKIPKKEIEKTDNIRKYFKNGKV